MYTCKIFFYNYNFLPQMQLLNHKHSGLVVSTYTSDFTLVSCSNTTNIQVDKHEYGLIILDVIILVFCIVSLVLSTRSIFRANTLKIVSFILHLV